MSLKWHLKGYKLQKISLGGFRPHTKCTKYIPNILIFKVDPSAQLLHVYMVSEKKKKGSTGSPARSGSVDPPRNVDSNRRNVNPGEIYCEILR